MKNEFQLCNHCGEMFFKEHLNKKDECKCCELGHERYLINEISNSENE